MEGDFRVGECLVQPKVGTITKGDREVSLEPKVMEVLVYLAQHTDDVLPKERIIHAVWGDTFVTDEVLTNAISELRRAFGDDAKDPRFIQTLPRRGYRLIAPVLEPETVSEELDTEPSLPLEVRGPRVQNLIVLLATVLLVAVVLILWWSPFSETEGPIDSIAVLPFANAGDDPSAEYLCIGIPGSIASRLSQIPQLRVVPTYALNRYKGQTVSPEVAADELKVRSVLVGTLVQLGDTLNIRVELVDGKENRLLWGESYEREFADLFAIREEVVNQIVTALRLQLGEEEQHRLTLRHTENLEAYEYYLKGQFHAERLDHEKAIPYFEQAIKEDPSYALAFVALAESHQHLGFLLTSEEHYQRAREPAERALEIDPELAEAHLKMAEILAFYDRDWASAESEWRRASDLDPVLTSYGLPHLLLWMGRRDEAQAAIQRFEEKGDPLSAEHHGVMAHRYYWDRKFDMALEKAQRSKEINPEIVIDYLVLWCYEAKGMEEAAFQVFLSYQSAEQAEEYRLVFRESGMQGVRRRQLEVEDIERMKPFDLAACYALAYEKDLAFDWLNKVYELPVFIGFFTDARFDSLRGDPRYEQLLRKQNLAEEAIQRHLAIPEGVTRRQ